MLHLQRRPALKGVVGYMATMMRASTISVDGFVIDVFVRLVRVKRTPAIVLQLMRLALFEAVNSSDRRLCYRTQPLVCILSNALLM